MNDAGVVPGCAEALGVSPGEVPSMEDGVREVDIPDVRKPNPGMAEPAEHRHRQPRPPA